MNTAEILHTIAVVSAWARADGEAVEVLIRDAGPELYANLIEFVVMILNQNTENNAASYLEFLSQQARALQAAEATS